MKFLSQQTSRGCPKRSNFVPQEAPDSISERVFFKNFLGGHAPRPPRRLMFHKSECALHTTHKKPQLHFDPPLQKSRSTHTYSLQFA